MHSTDIGFIISLLIKCVSILIFVCENVCSLLEVRGIIGINGPGQQEEEGAVGPAASRGPPSSPVNIAFTSGYKEGGVSRLRAGEAGESLLGFCRIKSTFVEEIWLFKPRLSIVNMVTAECIEGSSEMRGLLTRK